MLYSIWWCSKWIWFDLHSERNFKFVMEQFVVKVMRDGFFFAINRGSIWFHGLHKFWMFIFALPLIRYGLALDEISVTLAGRIFVAAAGDQVIFPVAKSQYDPIQSFVL